MVDIVKSSENKIVFDMLLRTLKSIAKDNYKEDWPFIYNNGEKEVAVLISNESFDKTITFLSGRAGYLLE